MRRLGLFASLVLLTLARCAAHATAVKPMATLPPQCFAADPSRTVPAEGDYPSEQGFPECPMSPGVRIDGHALSFDPELTRLRREQRGDVCCYKRDDEPLFIR